MAKKTIGGVHNKKLALLGGPKVREKPFPAHPVMGADEKKAVLDVIGTGQLSGFVAKAGDFFLGGPKVKKLEEEFCRYFGVKYAMAVNSATAGLHCALAAVGVGPGDEVIVSPYTMSASASAILMANAVPVFVDIDPEIFCLDPKKVKLAITPRTKAIVVVHLFGQAADMTELMKIAGEHRLKVIEDCAQSPAATYKGKYVGTLGDAGIFSFNQHKTITTGEGGVVVTNDPAVAQKVRLVRNHGEAVVTDGTTNADLINTLGWNYRMTELEAAVGIAQFRKLNRLTRYRVELARMLTRELKRLDLPGIRLPTLRPGNNHVYFVYPIKFDEGKVGISRNTLLKALNAEGIPFAGGYVQPLYLAPMYQRQLVYGEKGCPFKCPFYDGRTNYAKGLCPVTERMHEKELLLTGLCRFPVARKDIRDIVLAFKKIFAAHAELKKYEDESLK